MILKGLKLDIATPLIVIQGNRSRNAFRLAMLATAGFGFEFAGIFMIIVNQEFGPTLLMSLIFFIAGLACIDQLFQILRGSCVFSITMDHQLLCLSGLSRRKIRIALDRINRICIEDGDLSIYVNSRLLFCYPIKVDACYFNSHEDVESFTLASMELLSALKAVRTSTSEDPACGVAD